jgi:hypothetical protein
LYSFLYRECFNHIHLNFLLSPFLSCVWCRPLGMPKMLISEETLWKTWLGWDRSGAAEVWWLSHCIWNSFTPTLVLSLSGLRNGLCSESLFIQHLEQRQRHTLRDSWSPLESQGVGFGGT